MEVKTEAADKRDRGEEAEWRRERRAYSLTAEHNVLSCPLSSLSLSSAHGRGDCAQLFAACRNGNKNVIFFFFTNESVASVVFKQLQSVKKITHIKVKITYMQEI